MPDMIGGGPTTPSEDMRAYSPEELRAIALYDAPSRPDTNCDWCGKPFKGMKSGARVCRRCWANREQIAQSLRSCDRDDVEAILDEKIGTDLDEGG